MTDDNQEQKPPKNMSRRQFLKMAGSTPFATMGVPPALALFTAILEGQCQKAWAQDQGIRPRALVNICANGAPARWAFNNFLNPYNSPDFNPHPMVASEFKKVGNRYIGGQYVTYARKGIHVPTCFTHNLPAPGGGSRPMANLLDNLLCIQGISTRNGGHQGSQLGAFIPPGSRQSASALSADASDNPFAAINLGGFYTFKSISNKSTVSPRPDQGIAGLLSTFQPTGTTAFQSNRSLFDTAFKSVLPALDTYAKSGHKGAQAIIENKESAISLSETNFADLAGQWTTLVTKYQDLVTRSFFDPNRRLTGLNDLPIGEGGTGSAELYELDYLNPVGYNTLTDFGKVIGASTTVTNLAESFALTEYILLNELSSSISLNIGSAAGLVDPKGKTNATMVSDSHLSGFYPHTLVSALRHRAGAACTLELISVLKAANMFNDVVIREAGEFNRVPRKNLSGSDHGSGGLSHALYCGAFNGPLIIGNLAKATVDGHWGQGGQIPQLGRQLYLSDTIATLAHLLRVPPPLTSASSLVTLSNSGLISNIGTTTYV